MPSFASSYPACYEQALGLTPSRTPSKSPDVQDDSSIWTNDCSLDTASSVATIEVSTGVFKQLRGSQETNKAWNSGGCIEAICYACDTRLACIDGCDCVICPACLSISPVLGASTSSSGSVGLGIKL